MTWRRAAVLVPALLGSIYFLAFDDRPDPRVVSHQIEPDQHLSDFLTPLDSRVYNGTSDDLPLHRIYGDNLETAVAGQLSSFYVEFPNWRVRDAPPLDDTLDIYARFEGPAIASPTVSYAGNGRYLVEYKLQDVGRYELHVELFKRTSVSLEFWLPLGSSPYDLKVKPWYGSLGRHHGSAISTARKICPDLSFREGRWLRCNHAETMCHRYGWVWAPHECRLPLVSPSVIASQPVWILFIGTSVQRGAFFAGLDYLLGAKRAASLTNSSFWKCWGFMDITVGNVRISYLDYRHECTYSDGRPRAEMCTGDYKRLSIEMMQKISTDSYRDPSSTAKRWTEGPTLVAWELNYAYYADISEVSDHRSYFDKSWKGKLITHWQGKSPRLSWRGIFPEMPLRAHKLFNEHPEWGLDDADLQHMAMPMAQTMEMSNQVLSQHWHRSCNENGMHSCSPYMDMFFQMIFGYTVISKFGYDYWTDLVANNSISEPTYEGAYHSSVNFCLQCPPVFEFSSHPERAPVCHDALPE